jgi:hypothetical protein
VRKSSLTLISEKKGFIDGDKPNIVSPLDDLFERSLSPTYGRLKDFLLSATTSASSLKIVDFSLRFLLHSVIQSASRERVSSFRLDLSGHDPIKY